jgi:trigger factor
LTLPCACLIISPHSRLGDVLELADRHDLGSCAARRVGSSPTVPTRVESDIARRSSELKFEKTVLDDHQAQVVVEIEPDRFESARHKAARSLASRGKVPGFRPGKAPFDVIVRHYGEEAVRERALDLLVDEIYPDMLKEAEIDPAAAGVLEKVDDAAQPKFTFKVPLAPEVVLSDYRKIRIPYTFEAPGPEKLEQALDELRQAYATTETVDRAAQVGDYVVLDLQSEIKSLTRSNVGMIIRVGASEEFPFPGFTEQLVGMSVGDTKTLRHKFPEDADDAALAGTTAEMQASLKAVRSMTLPAVDEAFAKMVGPFDSVEALRTGLAKDLETRDRANYDDEYYTKVVDAIREKSTIKYAPQTLEHEAQHVVEDMRNRLARQGLELETYYKMRNTDAAAFMKDEAMPIAARRLERSLILDEIARREKVEVDNQALDEEFNSTLLGLQNQGVNLNAVRGGKQGQKRVAEAVALQSANRLLTRRTLERLRMIASGENAPLPPEGEAGETSEKAPKARTSKKTPAKAAAKSKAKARKQIVKK